MFFDSDRLPIMQRVITSPTLVERREAVDALLPFQRGDFTGLFRAMDGQPVIIRLLDPPLHEFLPSFDDLTRKASDLQIQFMHAKDLPTVDSLVAELSSVRSLLERVDELREANPMLGLRGVRLGLRIPELTRMQTRAIVEAALMAKAEGVEAKPEIMVPLVSHAGEMAEARSLIEGEMAAVFDEHRDSLEIPIGAMIEVPRAALTAREIAEHAEFFSFGTNDLTQMTMGMSRDDAEANFLLMYMRDEIISANPFHTLDLDGVGRLMQLAVDGGRAANSDLPIGICGEHGGEAASIAFAHEIGLGYVSCSAPRVPVARLAAAHAALAAREG